MKASEKSTTCTACPHLQQTVRGKEALTRTAGAVAQWQHSGLSDYGCRIKPDQTRIKPEMGSTNDSAKPYSVINGDGSLALKFIHSSD